MTLSTQAAVAKVPIRCLVIQLARLGDTIQSLMALRAAQQLYPRLEIHMLTREKFSSAAKRVSWIKNVVTFPTDSVLGPFLNGEKNETQTISEIAQWISPLVQEPWDFVINWSFSEASSYLTALMPARVKLGYTRRRDSSFSGADGWSHYIQAIVQGGIAQNIHLTDILTTQLLTALQIHVGDPVPDNNAPITSKGFFTLSLNETEMKKSQVLDDGKKKWIAVQVGAGQEEKTWSPENWGKLVKYIAQRHPGHGVVLLGGKENLNQGKALLEEISSSIRENHSVISLIGETSFDLWASVVSRCQWLIAGDTAAIHLASVLGTRIINVSVGPVKYLETGPYGNGHYVISSYLECMACLRRENNLEHTCRNSVSPEIVYSVWSYGSSEWAHQRQISMENHFLQLGWGSHLDSASVYRSRIRQCSDGGGVIYEPMVRRLLGIQDWNSFVMGHVARSWYCGWVPPVGQEINREMISPQLIQKLRELQDSSEVLSKICEKANLTADELHRKSSAMKSHKVMGLGDRQSIQELGNSLLELETLIDRLAKTHLPLLAYSQMSKILMHHLKGTELSDLGREAADSYKQLNEGVSILREWIRYTLDLARPVPLEDSGNHPLRPKPIKELSP